MVLEREDLSQEKREKGKNQRVETT